MSVIINRKESEERANERFLNPSYPSNPGWEKNENEVYVCPRCKSEFESMEKAVQHICKK